MPVLQRPGGQRRGGGLRGGSVCRGGTGYEHGRAWPGAAGTAPLRYQWRRAGVDLSGQTNASFSVSNAQVSDSGTYLVLVTNRVGQALSAPASVTVLAPPLITAQPQSQTNLAGGTAVLS